MSHTAAYFNDRSVSPGLFPRLFALALLFSLELVVISIWIDGVALQDSRGLAAFAHDWGAWILRAVVGFAALFATFTWLRNKAALIDLSDELTQAPIAWGMAAAHIGAMACFLFLSWLIYAGGFGGIRTDAAIACWLTAGILAIGLAGLAVMPSFAWRRLILNDRYLWAWAALAVFFACVVGNQVRALWEPATHLTFFLARAVLRPFTSAMIADPAAMTLGTPRFAVRISPECSGFEGAGLIAAFGIVWLIVFRKDCRWPHALLLIPAGVAILFLLNAVRIAALILIGDRGAARIATGGFHSQAGWIAFNFVALGFSIAARELPWFNTRRRAHRELAVIENPVTPWVLPVVAILAAGMLSSALTGDFEWFYPLRFVAAAAALWYFRRRYRVLDWRFGWQALMVGSLVFLVWIARDLLHGSGSSGMPPALSASSPEVRIGWLTIRVISAIVTVPIAEELAFRGFLMRRLVSTDFESVPSGQLSWLALLVSSFLFGLLHGGRWLEGTAAGLLYGAMLLRRGRIGDAIAAHATTNALLAFSVLAFHQWQLW